MINAGVDFESKKFISLCQKHKVKELYAFGSVVNERFTDNSDIDLLVEIDEHDSIRKGKLLLSIWDGFEAHFGRKVDLLTPNSLKNPYLKASIDETKKLVYAGSEKEVLS